MSILLTMSRTRCLLAFVLLSACLLAGCGAAQPQQYPDASSAVAAPTFVSSYEAGNNSTGDRATSDSVAQTTSIASASADATFPCERPANAAECASKPPAPRLLSSHLHGHTVLVKLVVPQLASKWSRSLLQVTVRSNDKDCSAGQADKANPASGEHTLRIHLYTVVRPITTLAQITALDTRIKTKIGGYGLLSDEAQLGPAPCQANHRDAG